MGRESGKLITKVIPFVPTVTTHLLAVLGEGCRTELWDFFSMKKSQSSPGRGDHCNLSPKAQRRLSSLIFQAYLMFIRSQANMLFSLDSLI